MKHDVFFRKHPVFTGKELADHLLPLGEVGGRTQEALLAYHRKAGRLVQVRRGLYAVIPPGANPDSYPVDPFLVAAKLTPDAVLSHHTALEFHGKAYSVHTHFTYSASRPLGPLTFRGHVFRGTRFRQALLRLGKEHFGVLTSERSGQKLKVTSLERTLVDVLDRPDLSGSWEEIWRSLESVEFFDLDKVLEYALLTGLAREPVVVSELEPFLADVIDIGEADQVAGDLARRVVTTIFTLDVDAGDAEAGDLRRLVRTHMATQIHELLARILRHPPCKLLVIDPQRIGEFADSIRRLRQATRVQPDAIDRRADGERLSVAIGNDATMRRDLRHAQLAHIALSRQELCIEHLQVNGTRGEHDAADHHASRDESPTQREAASRGGILVSLGLHFESRFT